MAFNLVRNNLARALPAIVAPSMDALGKLVLAEAQRLCPIDTGQLYNSLGFTYRQDTGTLQIHADQWYAVYVEFGTSRQAAQPFLRPALLAAPALWKQVEFQTQVRTTDSIAKIPQAARDDPRFNIRTTDAIGFPLS